MRGAGVGVAAASVVAATIALVASTSPVSTAASPTVAPIVVADSIERMPLVSADGSVVVFTSSIESTADDDAEPQRVLRLRDRAAATTVDLAGDVEFVGLSGDSCVVAWAATPTDEAAEAEEADESGAFEVEALDRCLTPPAEAVSIGRFDVAAQIVLDEAGTTLAINTGSEIVRFERSSLEPADPFTESNRFDALAPPSDTSLTIGRIAMSADGSVIEGLYAAGNVMANCFGSKGVGAGTTLGPCLTWGYIAGINAAA